MSAIYLKFPTLTYKTLTEPNPTTGFIDETEGNLTW